MLHPRLIPRICHVGPAAHPEPTTLAGIRNDDLRRLSIRPGLGRRHHDRTNGNRNKESHESHEVLEQDQGHDEENGMQANVRANDLRAENCRLEQFLGKIQERDQDDLR